MSKGYFGEEILSNRVPTHMIQSNALSDLQTGHPGRTLQEKLLLSGVFGLLFVPSATRTDPRRVTRLSSPAKSSSSIFPRPSGRWIDRRRR